MPHTKKKTPSSVKRRKNKKTPPSQINGPFEQEIKRPIGQHGATGWPPLMKK